MVNARRFGQLGTFAVGIGIGSAMAAAPGIASADDAQVASLIDPSGLFAAADPAQSSDFQISIDGMDLFPTAGNSATAVSGLGDIAIASGDGAQAIARGGTGDYATATGTGAFAEAGDGGVGASGNNYDYASASGTDADAQAGDDPNSEFADATGNSFNTATATGTNASAYAGFAGSNDIATANGNLANAAAGDNGNSDFANAVGGNTDAEAGESGSAVPADHDIAVVLGNMLNSDPALTQAISGGGFSALSGIIGDGGSNDIAFTNDPFGILGSDAVAGLGNSFDVAGAFGDHLVANAFDLSNLVNILPSL
jgi:hypothetical protein